MNEEHAVGGFWSALRDLNAAYLILGVGFAALLFAIYVFRYRTVAIGELLPTLDRIQAIAVGAAFALLVVAAAATLWKLISSALNDEDSAFGSLLSSAKGLNAAYVIFALILVAFLVAIYLLRNRAYTISDLWGFQPLSFALLRNSMIAICVVLVASVIIVSLGRYVWIGMFGREFTSIAPFTIAGSDDKQRGFALATALQAKLAELERDAEALDGVLRKAAADDESETQIPNQDTSELNSLNVYRKVDFDLKFQGVDVGGVLNWLVNSVAMRRALQITVAEQGDSAVVTGALRADGTSYVYASVKGGNERIVAAVAYSKLREQLIAQQSQFEALEWEDVELLHHTIMSVARLRARSQATMQDFSAAKDAIAKLIARAPRLEPLLTLGAEVAMKAGDADGALAYLEQTKDFLNRKREELDRKRREISNDDASNDETNDAKDEFARVKREFVTRYNARVVLRERIISSCALRFAERLNSREPPERVFVDALALHKRLLSVDAIEKRRDVTVAIIGGIPQRELIGYQLAAEGNWIPGKYGLDNFADTIGLIVATLAPGAKLIFLPLGHESRSVGLSLFPNEDEIAQAVDTAAAARADVVLIPFTAANHGRWRSRINTLTKHSERMMFVTTAPPRSVQKRLAEQGIDISAIPAAFVANVDVDGRFKGGILSLDEQPVSYPGAIWAPGTRIPRLTSDGMWQTTYGNVYAAATAAAVVANVAAAVRDKKTPRELIDLLGRTRRHVDPRDPGVGILDQTSALEGDELGVGAVAQLPNLCGT